MPTDLELITSYTSLSSDARTILEKLKAWIETDAEITWNLSGSVTITADSLPRIIAAFETAVEAAFLDFYKSFGGAYSTAFTYNSDGTIATELATYQSGWTMLRTYSYTSGRISSVALILTDDSAVEQWTGTATYTYSGDQLTGIAVA